MNRKTYIELWPYCGDAFLMYQRIKSDGSSLWECIEQEKNNDESNEDAMHRVLIDVFGKDGEKMKEVFPDVLFIFPVKCCKSEKVLRTIAECADGFDVSNMNEYNFIMDFAQDKKIFSTGPMSYELAGVPGVNVALNRLSRDFDGLGIRINFNDDTRFEKSHFGISIKDVPESVRKSCEYVHFHVSDKKTAYVCSGILDHVKMIVDTYPNLRIMNIGGHLNDFDFEEAVNYLRNVQNILPDKVQLVVEAGDFFVSNCGTLYCKAEDSFFSNGKQIVYLNFSKLAQQRWVHPKLKEKCEDEVLYDTCFYGSSCCEGDIFHEEKAGRISIGETLCFENISSYSYEWNQSFNGIDKIKFYFD